MIKNKKLFEDILADYQDHLFRMAWSYTNNPEDHEDLFQNILLQIWESLKSFKSKSSIGTWVYRVALNTCFSYLRRANSNVYSYNNTDDRLSGIISGVDIENDIIRNEELRILHNCINKLSVIEKTLITLYLDEIKYNEIARIMGVSEKNVSVKLSRIKKKMNNMIKEEKDENDR